MKIGISSPYLDSLGGGERYMLTIASCLSKNYDVDVFWSDAKIKQKAQKILAIDLNRVKIVEDIFYSGQKLPEKLIKSLNYELIIFLSDGSVPLSFAKKNILLVQQPFQNIGGDKILNRIKLRKVNAVVCYSRFTKSFIDKEYNVDSKVVYPPVSVDLFNTAEEKGNIILSVGRFNKFKKHAEMINMFKKLENIMDDWSLVICGGLLQQDRKYYGSLVNKTKGYRIKLFPNIEFDKLQKLYSRAKIYWHAAGYGENEEKNPSGMEHFGITTVEAMASGCVPVCFNGGGQKEIIKHAQNGFLWNTQDEFKKYTIKIAENDKLRNRISKQAIKDSKKYSVDRFCREINKLVKNL